MAINETSLRKIHDIDSLLAFLREPDPANGLGWMMREDVDAEELFYDYTDGNFANAGDGLKLRQLINMTSDQPWGVFLVETSTPKLYTTELRRLLRVLAPKARAQHSFLPAWPTENLLFIATHDYREFTFAHFEGSESARAKLKTFGWSQTEVGVRTLCEHNLPALRWPHNPEDGGAWLSQWSSAFDVEKVTDRFFKDFRDLFEGRKEALEREIKNAAERHAFVQRLLNRLLFLSFLQKKRWLKAPNTPHPQATYLFDLFDQAEAQGENFYETYLHDLFFSALNRPLRADAANRKRVESRLGIVPFLNGGLFDRVDEWDDVGQLKLDNDFFQSILGRDGLLRRYNFTVTESTPLNQEVAVDPEMLGKVFETVVLTSEGADAYQAPNLRKATGSYYTPRIVVTFIVREALKSDLTAHVNGLRKENLTRLMEWDALAGLTQDNRSALRELVTGEQADAILKRLAALRACDPSIGSGAFALGLLHELLNLHLLCRNITDFKDPMREKRNTAFDIKKQIIEHNIYGVDLQAKAVEICKLRLWLSLIVDYELSVDPDASTAPAFAKAVEDIPALPNLGFKIRRGDALLDLVKGKVFRLKEIGHDAEMQDTVERLQVAHETFFSAQDPNEKRALRLKALTERTSLSRLQIEAQLKELENRNATQSDMFAVKETKASIQAAQAERERLEEVLKGIRATEKELKKLAGRRLSEKDDASLTQLEALNEKEEITFAWELDFPEIFFTFAPPASTLTGKMGLVNEAKGQMEIAMPASKRGGFDIIVGNPPFVTARNAEKRELYRERWKETCAGKYQLVAPFFQRSFGLLHQNGYLGFIVSNAFTKREFGKPLVEDFFPTIEVSKIIDCSGLMFPGHGTPTCMVFGKNMPPKKDSFVRIVATLPGGGDLLSVPEKSELWLSIEANHDSPNYRDHRISVDDKKQSEISKWPVNLDVGANPTKELMEANKKITLKNKVKDNIGFDAVTAANEIFCNDSDFFRRQKISKQHVQELVFGEIIRDYELRDGQAILYPYDRKDFQPVLTSEIEHLLIHFKKMLEGRSQFHKTQVEAGLKWYEYREYHRRAVNPLIIYTDIATHFQALYSNGNRVSVQTALVIELPNGPSTNKYHLLVGLLNSSAVLFWLKQVCFNKNASDQEEKDRFVYSGGKVEQLPLPVNIDDIGSLQDKLSSLSCACWECGQQIASLSFKKLFEQKGEAYHGWYSSLAGYVAPHAVIAKNGFKSAEGLASLVQKAQSERERLRGEMIALQEEMDWLVYEAYGLTADDGRLTVDGNWKVEPLALGERPFELLRDGNDIPGHFSAERKALWQRRMDVIQSNEHIRRIEQPVYKRRWYRKVNDEKELQNAYEWFLLEKAEYWLEKTHKRPVEVNAWAKALWEDERIRAGAQVVHAVESLDSFVKLFKTIVKTSAVPAWIPPAMPWEQVEKKFKDKKVPAIAKKVRGKLNVPRERFRVRDDGQFVWAGEE
jgi:hypothetical protein